MSGRQHVLPMATCQSMALSGKKDRAQSPAKLIREAKRLGKAPGVAPRTGEERSRDFANSMATQSDCHAALHKLVLASPFGQQLSLASRSRYREGIALLVATCEQGGTTTRALRSARIASGWDSERPSRSSFQTASTSPALR